MRRILYVIIIWSFFMDQSIAKEYFYSNKIKNLPEPIKVEDTASQNDFFSYFNKDNLSKNHDRLDVFQPVIEAKARVEQVDPFKLKLDVVLTNSHRDWYIPRFDLKSIYSEKKVYLTDEGGKVVQVLPKWWPEKRKGPHSPSVYIPKAEHIGLFARFNKHDTYKLEYALDIPETTANQIAFNLYFMDSSTLPELFNKYIELNDNNLYSLVTRSNTIKVLCKKKSENNNEGYICDFEY
ncbi:hypothetical protein L293_3477 [Acinetobacter gyllenbergii CIP 110306 = MTCC 11365]|nr:hypothetical protein L293_3477 [Acinetobacter gyllenbergii CIP 110306 = MTCC 11365]